MASRVFGVLVHEERAALIGLSGHGSNVVEHFCMITLDMPFRCCPSITSERRAPCRKHSTAETREAARLESRSKQRVRAPCGVLCGAQSCGSLFLPRLRINEGPASPARDSCIPRTRDPRLGRVGGRLHLLPGSITRPSPPPRGHLQ
ncbi:hypothetical protein MRX96_046405 [Rhipicephalus microplus]